MSWMTVTREDRVRPFFFGAGKTVYKRGQDVDQSVMACVKEEFQEFFEAAEDYAYAETEDPVLRQNLVKEWADLAYVVSQAALYFDIPAGPAFNRVAENNLTKLGADGKAVFREDGKILKPEGYQKPDMSGL